MSIITNRRRASVLRRAGAGRLSIAALAALACTASPGCGQLAGDCSGGPGCGNGGPPVHWTARKTAAAARMFSYRPMVRGHMRAVRCRIVARYPDHEAAAICRGIFVTPPNHARRFVARFSLGASGAMNPYCSTRWTTSPYCNRRGHLITGRDR